MAATRPSVAVVASVAGGPLTSPLNLAGISPSGPAQVYRWTGGAIRRLADRPVPAAGFSATYPAASVTVYVVPS